MAATVLQSRPVGALACQKDSYLTTLDVEVVSCTKFTPDVDSKSSKTKAKQASSHSGKDLWQIEFTDSVLFPEGGGQHSDHGTLHPLDDTSGSSEPIAIGNVQRDGLRSICYSPQELAPGSKVRQSVDYSRRREHMQNHTGQHLLSAVMDTYENLETLGWGMGSGGSSNYVDLPRTPTKDEIRQIQQRCNEIISENVAIDVVYPEGDGLGQANGKSSEEKHEKGVIRIIKIGDIDANPCCGTHLRQTSHIRFILLQSTQTVRGKDCRLSFLTGDHAVQLAASSAEGIRSIAGSLSCGLSPEDVVANVERIKGNAAEGRRREAKLLKEIAGFEAEKLKVELKAGRNAYLHRPQEGPEFIQMVLFEVKQALKEVSPDVAVVLATGEKKEAGQIVVVGASAAAASLSEKLLASGIEVKGNGKGERWQGKVVEWKKGDLKMLEELVRGDI